MIRYLSICTLLFLTAQVSAQEIAVTFDDAPMDDGPIYTGNERTRKILAHLKDQQVNAAAFFVLTGNIKKQNRKRLRQYSRAGHILANHSHSHVHPHRLGIRAYIDDVQKADTILKRYAAYERWFRFPFLDEGRTVSARDSIRLALKQMGMSHGYVTVDNYDWYLNHLLTEAHKQKKHVNMALLRAVYVDHIYESIKFYDSIARAHLGRSPRHVLLLHENDLAALFLGDLIARLKNDGWKLISPREAYQDPIANYIPDVLFNGQGRIAAIAREKGVPPRQLVQESEDEDFLKELVNRRGVFE